jgi:hypothetical protein
MKKTIMVVDDRSGEILADVEELKLGAWFAKNRMVVVEWFVDMVSVRPA